MVTGHQKIVPNTTSKPRVPRPTSPPVACAEVFAAVVSDARALPDGALSSGALADVLMTSSPTSRLGQSHFSVESISAALWSHNHDATEHIAWQVRRWPTQQWGLTSRGAFKLVRHNLTLSDLGRPAPWARSTRGRCSQRGHTRCGYGEGRLRASPRRLHQSAAAAHTASLEIMDTPSPTTIRP